MDYVIEPISAFGIWKPMLGVRKHGRNDMDGFNPCGNRVTHFISWMENLNVANFAYKHKKVGTTFETWPIICTLLTSEGKHK